LKAATAAVTGALEGKAATKDDFSVPSTVSTEPHSEEQADVVAAAKIEGLGLANSTYEQGSMFSQSRNSSDDLVASLTDYTPSPEAQQWTNGDDKTSNGVPSEPVTPSPASRKAPTNGAMPEYTPSPSRRTPTNRTLSENLPSPHRIPKYKFALASTILSSSRAVSS
jgi:hypothetical protein